MDNEEAAELLSEMKLLHIPMKQWYNNDSHSGIATLKSKHGDFPMFARDLLQWGGWKECRKEYLRWVDAGKPASGSANNDGTVDAAVAATNTTEERGRKRRSRWHNEPTSNSGEAEAPKPRKSRWDRSAVPAVAPVVPQLTVAAATRPMDPVMAALGLSSNGSSTMGNNIPPDKQAEYASLQARLRKANSRLSNLEAEAARIDALPRNHPDRSPSPPPTYNPDGSRKNTRAARWKERYTEERSDCLEKLMALTNTALPSFIAKRKRSVKISIPVDEHPTYNFIGLIIGPRGKTQKEMENKTGCKIAIRGKGSIKEGARGRLNKTTPQEGEDEPLHVVVTGDDPTQIEIAAEMIRSMLVVIDDEVNVHKQNQLRELALLNGTLKENEEWCTTCGEKGHRDFECPKRFSLGSKTAGTALIKCAICGETSHPTRDCKRVGEEVEKKEQLDEDYSAFMAELDGKTVEKKEEGGGGASSIPVPVSNGGGDSVLTILQPARVVKSDGTLGEDVSGLVTTISSTVPGSSVPGMTAISSTMPGAQSFTGVTTISSTVPGSSTGITTISSTVPGVTTISSAAPGTETPAAAATINPPLPETNGLPLPPPPPPQPNMTLPLPPPPVGMPPPNMAPNNFAQPPPPPPPPVGVYPPQYPQQGYPYQYQQPGYPPQPYGQPPQPPQQQQWGATTNNGWDQAAYDPTGGAGGFNWWDSSED
eukprot:scaffold2552_cov59-Cyclotella_meneghiniana.AAC.3